MKSGQNHENHYPVHFIYRMFISTDAADENTFEDNKTVVDRLSPMFGRKSDFSDTRNNPAVARRNSSRHSGSELNDLDEISEAISSDENDVLRVPLSDPAPIPEWTVNPPIQFVSSDQESFHITDMGREYLLGCARGRRIVVITVCGLYRTGKSYLLNLLSGRIGPVPSGHQHVELFPTSGTVSACTTGIWIWASSSSGISAEDPVYLLVDCEGSGNVSNSKDHDSRLFAIAMLMSSYFMYNSRGVIEETSLSNLATVAAIAVSALKGEEVPARNRPRFMWILRDFVLSLDDRMGNPISSTEYLESCLRGRKPYKQLLSSLFSSLDCTTLITPANEEAKLQRLVDLGWEGLRPEFQRQIMSLRDKVFRDSVPKRAWNPGNAHMTGEDLLRFMEGVITHINSNDVPHVVSLWTQIQARQTAQTIESLEQDYQRKASEIDLPKSEVDLKDILSRLRKETLKSLRRNSLKDQMKDDVSLRMDIIDNRVLRQNQISTKEGAQELLRQLWKEEVMQPLRSATIAVSESEIEQKLDNLHRKYLSCVIGDRAVCEAIYDDNILPRREKLLVDVRQREPIVRYPSSSDDGGRNHFPTNRKAKSGCLCLIM